MSHQEKDREEILQNDKYQPLYTTDDIAWIISMAVLCSVGVIANLVQYIIDK